MVHNQHHKNRINYMSGKLVNMYSARFSKCLSPTTVTVCRLSIRY